jgi:drug/metabolite transporter (DMT)-like permease
MAVGFLWFDESISAASLLGLFAIAAGGLITLMKPGRFPLANLLTARPAIA